MLLIGAVFLKAFSVPLRYTPKGSIETTISNEPDIATIKYIDKDKIFTVYYDYGSKKYSAEA